MNLFRNLIVFGVVLVTVLVITDTVDARKKESKKKETESKYGNVAKQSKNPKGENIKKYESSRMDKLKKSNEYNTIDSENKFYKTGTKEGKSKSKNYKHSKKNEKSKITKTYEKVNKYKIVEDIPAKQFDSIKKTEKKTNAQEPYDQKVMDQLYVSLKKSSKMSNIKGAEEDNVVDEHTNEELNQLDEEEIIFVEEETLPTKPKRKTYKLVEVFLDEENPEKIETVNEADLDSEDDIKMTESEEVIEKYKATQTLKLPQTKKSVILDPSESGDEQEEEVTLEDEYDTQVQSPNEFTFRDDLSYSSRYKNIHDSNASHECKRYPKDPKRKTPTKVILNVIEEEINGQVAKRVDMEEDGVSMCEVAILMDNQFNYGKI